MDNYAEFLERKANVGALHGFEPLWIPDFLFPFQRALTEWAIRKGRAALFEDCGLGKSVQELVWAENVVRKTNRRVLILAPLAVSYQIVREAEKFGIEVKRSNDGTLPAQIVVTNYERLKNFKPEDFAGVICDESGILKSFNGATRNEVTTFMRKVSYRLLATATAAPNDFIELGTSSEALGYLGHVDMLNRFFKNDMNNSAQGRMRGEVIKWRLKGHAELPFWRWVCSWARACRRPSDIGFDDGDFILPPLTETEYAIEARTLADGMLFALPAIGLKEQREERRRTLEERCEKVAELVNDGDQALVWCHLNDEGELLEQLIPGAIEVAGKHSDDEKEDRLLRFISGDARVLVSKAKVAGFGLNLQNCAHVATFVSHSYESYYQSVRRCYRFGQHCPVQVDIVATDGESAVLKNLQRKAAQADRMFTNLVAEMNNASSVARSTHGEICATIPKWLEKRA